MPQCLFLAFFWQREFYPTEEYFKECFPENIRDPTYKTIKHCDKIVKIILAVLAILSSSKHSFKCVNCTVNCKHA